MSESPRVDCTVQAGMFEVKGRQFSASFMDWSLPEHQRIVQGRMIEILKAHGGEMHFTEYLKEYNRRFPNG
jgi:hypothetical protein